MRMKLIAIDPIEGKAFYEENNNFFHIRPLYEDARITPCTKEQMELEIIREGYYEQNEDFSNVKEIIEFVQDRYKEIRNNFGFKAPEDELLEKVVQKVDDHVLLEYIQKAITKWIPGGNIKGAKRLVEDIFALPKIKDRHELFGMAKKLDSIIKKADGYVPVHHRPEKRIDKVVLIQENYIENLEEPFVMLDKEYQHNFALFEGLLKQRRTRVPCMVSGFDD